MINRRFIVIIFLIFTSGVLFVRQGSATTPTVVGFVIEATQLEGTLKSVSLGTGDTAEQPNTPILSLSLEQIVANGLTIRKIVRTPSGNITVRMTSSDVATFRQLTVQLSNAQFSEVYQPTDGKIGFKQLKMLAHRIVSDDVKLPQLLITLESGGEAEITPANEEALAQMKKTLETLINNTSQVSEPTQTEHQPSTAGQPNDQPTGEKADATN
ncbi:hypothetical protein [Anoxybacteroides amylolyticum]|uniref:Uncharacterized protein n=1 Tax=Anoxybacteroides amylolyticum TaxID=294699 RepID=A0A160F2J8_9BACL|nr:hypothetical protein [Anoxybacillus amylolyticus]ANB59855.1 hypothetical protein GFC30_2483 [Anoxybacillus amylolyticus]